MAISVPTLSGAELRAELRDNICIQLPFTGERAVPGAVEPQLWNEHVSRYRFASLFAAGKRVLDIGCGTGYGVELLNTEAECAVGLDISDEAIQYARATFNQAQFLCGCAEFIPFPARSFHLVTAFEVIEHLRRWEAMLHEAARVVSADGMFLVSTPNIEYYAESRGNSGPNPFHIHEFELAEFRAALSEVFPYVEILAQNQQENITFSGTSIPRSCVAFIPPTPNVADCAFFIAVCSFRPASIPFFSDVSSTHNLLRDRERHIRGLQGELVEARKCSDELNLRCDVLSEINRSLTTELNQAQQCAWIRLGQILGLGPWRESGSQFALGSLVKRFFRPRPDMLDSIDSLSVGKAGDIASPPR